MQGSRHLAVSQQDAWDALNNPEILQVCIPGCDRVEADGENRYTVGMSVKIGPVSSRFTGKIALSDVMPPNSYTLSFEGQGGPAGFGKGTAKVALTPPAEGAGCELNYSAQAQVGGKIAQVGQRLVDGVAKAMAEDFFRRFDEEMKRRNPQAYAAQEALPPAEPAPAPEPASSWRNLPTWVWIAGGALLFGAIGWLLR